VSNAAPRFIDSLSAVLFDLDGTLLDTAPDLVNALNIVCGEQSVPPPTYEMAASNVSNGAIGLTKLAFPQLPEAEQLVLCQRLVAVYTENICVHTRPYPGMTELLAELDAAGVPWGVVTNKLQRLATPILAALDLQHNCKVIVGGDTAARNKPHPDPIIYALNELGLAAESVAYVGDHRKDVQAGQAAGTQTVAVTWGYIIPGEDPYNWNADYTIEQPEQFMTLPTKS
jgi:2-phosphoglycolate phosphatase